ncbi:hypothetical protein ACFLRB_01050 [Acidobacteriota bacterium]
MSPYQHPSGFMPLKNLIDTLPEWVKPLLDNPAIGQSGAANLLNKVGLSDYSVQSAEDSFVVTGKAQFLVSLEAVFPGIDGASLVLFPGTQSGNFATVEFSLTLKPDFKLTLKQPKIDINLPKNFLLPVKEEKDAATGKTSYQVDEKKKSITFSFTPGDITIDGKGNFNIGKPEAKQEGTAGSGIKAANLALGKTGIFLVDVEVGIDSRENDVAVTIPKARVVLPEDLIGKKSSLNLLLENGIIDKQGFSGSISMVWGNPAPISLLGFTASLEQFSVACAKNRLTNALIKGEMIIPFFDDPKKPKSPVKVIVGLGSDGRISVGLEAKVKDKGDKTNALTELDLGFLLLQVSKISIESEPGDSKEARRVMVLSGRIILDKKGKQPLSIEIKDLKIYPDGSVSFPGGWFDVKDKLTYNKGGFKIGISKIGLGFGEGEKRESFIGFNGAMQLVGSLPAGASVEGMRFTWDHRGRFGFHISGVGLNFTIPNTLKFEGGITFFDPQNPPNLPGFEDLKVTGLKGKVALTLIPLELAVDADILVAVDDKGKRFWFVKVGLELPVGIMLGPTGLAIYGFHGLLAENMVPSKTEQQHWYRDWYRSNPVGVDHSAKWKAAKKDSALAVGIGATIGTALDKGKAFNCRALLVISLPGPILMLTGKANILTDRSKLADPNSEGQFQFLLLFDGEEKSLLFNLGVNFSRKKYIEIRGLLEVFFHFADPDLWHLYLGEEPEPKRIQATILNFLQANSYLMLDSRKFKFGFFIGYRPKPWVFGPLKVTLAAYMQGDVLISWNPEFFNTELRLVGELAIEIFWFKLGLMLDAGVKVSSPKPFLLDIYARAKLSLPWPLPNPEVALHLVWKEILPPDFSDPLLNVQLDHNEALENTQSWEVRREDNFPDTYKPAPMDARISIVFERQVGLADILKDSLFLRNKDGSRAPLPCQSGKFRMGEKGINFLFDYQLIGIKLKYKDNKQNTWLPQKEDFEKDIYFSWATRKVTDPKQVKAATDNPESAVLQIGTTDPNRMSRTRTNLDLSAWELDWATRSVCPEQVPLPLICWQPEPVTEPQLWIGSRDEEAFLLSITGTCYRGDIDPCTCLAAKKPRWPEGEDDGIFTPDLPPEPGVTDDPAITGIDTINGITGIGTGVAAGEFLPGILPVSGTTIINPGLICLRHGSLTFNFKEPMSYVGFEIKYRGSIEFELLAADGKHIAEGSLVNGTSSWDVLTYPPAKQLVTGSPPEIVTLSLTGDCFCLVKLCHTPYRYWEYAEFVNRSRTYWQGAVEQWAYSGLILRPNTTYRLEVDLKGSRSRQQVGENREDYETFNHAYYFKTGGPPRDITPYVEKTVPTGESALFFRDYYVEVLFKAGCDYVPAMFDKLGKQEKKDTKLELHLRDEEKKARIYDVFEVEGKIFKYTRTQEILRKSAPCLNKKFKEIERTNRTTQWRFGPKSDKWLLKPQTRYQALLMSKAYTKPLYIFSFVTSRFENFRQMITSHMTHWNIDLDNPRDLSGKLLPPDEAVKFRVRDVDRDKWWEILNRCLSKEPVGHDAVRGKTSRAKEEEDFRDLTTALHFPPYLRPPNVEVFQVFDSRDIFGFLIDFPEPIDWQRTRIKAELQRIEPGTGTFIQAKNWFSHKPETEFSFLRSRDGSRAFLAFNPGKKTVVTRDPFAAMLNKTLPEETVETIPFHGPETTLFATEVSQTSPVKKIFRAIGGWLRLTGDFLNYTIKTLLGQPVIKQETYRLNDRGMLLKLKVTFHYTLDFLQELGISTDDQVKVGDFFKKHPDLQILHRNTQRLKNGSSVASEEAELFMTFNNILSGEER